MANSIDLITKYFANPANLNGVFVNECLTKDLEVNGKNVIDKGANIVKIKNYSFGAAGVADYSKTSGHTALDANVAWESITLAEDIGNSLKIDNVDLMESETAPIEVANEYVRQLIVPKVDKYRLATIKGVTGVTAASATAALANTSIEAQIDLGIASFKNNAIPTTGAVLYINVTSYELLADSSKSTHNLLVGGFPGAVDKDITTYRGVKVVVLPDTYLPTKVDFMLVQPKCVWAVAKHEKATFWDKVPGYDGAEVDYRLYHGAGVFGQRKKGVYYYAHA